MATDWGAIAAGLTNECPSASLRGATVRILQRVEILGPLSRQPRDEFLRVYDSLQWNDADRILQIVNALLPRVEGPNPKLVIRLDAWGYAISVHDAWIAQARVFYLVAGIVETALRARIDTRLTDAYGTPEWHNVDGLMPSGLRELTTREERDAQLLAVHGLVEAAVEQGAANVQAPAFVAQLEAALRPPTHARAGTGAEFLRGVTLAGVKMLLTTGRLWEGQADLRRVFRGRDGQGPGTQREQVGIVLDQINKARNEVSHYRPERYFTFDRVTMAAATLASWLGEDLQHVYGAIDTRNSTELSVALSPMAEHARWAERAAGHTCEEAGCAIPLPFDWYLDRAPLDENDLPAVPVSRKCLHHRVVTRAAVHRPAPAVAAAQGG